MGTTVRIDGDVVKYRCGFAAEKGEYILSYGDGGLEAYTYKKDLEARIAHLGLEKEAYAVEYSRRPEPVENALHSVKIVINEIKEACDADDLVVYLSGPSNYRNGIARTRPYKGNRDPEYKPVHGEAIVAYLIRHYPYVLSDGEEADDCIGIDHYAAWLRDDYSTCIATIDKDLDQIPGLHYNFVKKEFYHVDADTAMHNFYRQLLMGDTVDNVPGIPGIGPRYAEKYLAGCTTERELSDVCAALYAKEYGEQGAEVMLEMGRLLWIRRERNQMWEPPKETE